jgi:hypothetical protein
MPDYISRQDAIFTDWQKTLNNIVDTEKDSRGIGDEESVRLQFRQKRYAVAGNKHNRTDAGSDPQKLPYHPVYIVNYSK